MANGTETAIDPAAQRTIDQIGPPASQGQQPQEAPTDPAVQKTLDQMTQQEAFKGVPGAGTPESPYQGAVQWLEQQAKNYVSARVGVVGAAYKVGQSGARDSALGHAVMGGQMSLEEAKSKIDSDEEAKAAAHNLEQYQIQMNHSWYDSVPILNELTRTGDIITQSGISVAKALPFLQSQLLGNVGGNVGARGVAAAAGIGGTVAARFAGVAGVVLSTAMAVDYIRGQDYLERRLKGANDHDAKVASTVVGGVNGIMQGFMARNLLNVPVDAAKAAIEAQAAQVAKGLIPTLMGTYPGKAALFTVEQTAFNEASTAVKLITDAVQGTVSKIPGMVPTVEEALKEFGQTLQDSVAMSLPMHGLGTVAGKTIGAVLRGTVKTAATIHMKNQQAKLAQLQEHMAALQEGLVGENATGETEKNITAAERARQLREEARADIAKQIEDTEKEIADQKKNLKTKKRELKAKEDQASFATDQKHMPAIRKEFKLEIQKIQDDIKSSKEKLADLEANADALEAEHQKIARDRLAKLVKKIPPGKQGSKYGRENNIQDMLDLFKFFYDNPNEVEKYQKQQEQIDAGEKVETSADEELKRDVANLVGNWKEKDAASVEELADDIEDLQNEGKANRIAQLFRRNAKVKNNIEQLKTIIAYKEPVSTSPNRVESPITLLGRVRNGFLGFLGNWQEAWYGALRGAPKDVQEKAYEILDPGQIIDEKNRGVREWNEAKDQALMDATGLTGAQVKELQRVGRRKNTIMLEAAKNDKTEQVPMTLMEAVKMLGELRNPDLEKRFIEANGFPDDITERLTKQVQDADPSGAYLKMVDGYAKFYQDYYPELAAAFKKDKGVKLPRDPYYAGYVNSVRDEEFDQNKYVAQLNEGGRAPSRTAPEPGFLKARTSNLPIAPQDAEHAASSHIQMGEQYKAWRQPSKEVFGPILRNGEIRRGIRNKTGGGTILGALDRGMDYFLRGSPKEQVAWAGTLNKWFAGIRFNALANNWLYLPEHFLSQIAGAQYIPIDRYFGGLADYYGHPGDIVAKIDKIVGSSEAYKKRYEDLEQAEAGSSLPPLLRNPNYPKVVNDILVTYHKFGLGALTIGSKSQVLPIIHSVFKYWKEEGLSDSEAMYRASMAAENVSTSARPDITSGLSHMPGANWALMFQQQVNHFGVQQLIAADRFLANPSTETFKEAAKVQIITGLAAGTFPWVRAAYKYGTATSSKERDEAIFRAEQGFYHILMPGSYMIGVNQAFDAATTKWHNIASHKDIPIYEFSLPVLDTINKTGSFMGELMTDMYKGKWGTKEQKRLGTGFFGGPGATLGTGLKNPARFYEDVQKKLQHGGQ